MVFIDGFEQFKGSTELAIALIRAGYTAPGGQNNASVATQAGRAPGGLGLRVTDSFLSRLMTWRSNKFVVGFAAFPQARGTLLTLRANNRVMSYWLNPENGAPTIGGREGGSVPWAKYWYYHELVLDRAANTMTVFINGREEVSAPLPDTVAGSFEVEVQLGTKTLSSGGGPEVGPPCTYDDFYVNDGEMLGPIQITTRFPMATLNADWEHSPEAGSNHEATGTRPPKYLDVNVSSGTIGATDIYSSSQAITSPNPVVVTGMCVLARKSPQFDARLGVFIGNIGSVERRDAGIAIGSDWKTHYVTFPKNIDDTSVGIQNAPFGISVVNGPVQLVSANVPDHTGDANGRYDAGIRLLANGVWESFRVSDGGIVASGTWLGSGASSAVEVMAVDIGPYPPHLGTLNTWLPCNQRNEWHSAVVTATTTERYKETIIRLDFRDTGGTTVFHNAIIRLTVGVPPVSP